VTANSVNLEAALRDPASVFATPEEVAVHSALTKAQEIEILRLWEYDAAEEEVATEEGMPGRDGDLLRRILLALDALFGVVDVGESAPTKQHALLPRSSGRK